MTAELRNIWTDEIQNSCDSAYSFCTKQMNEQRRGKHMHTNQKDVVDGKAIEANR